MPTSSFDLYIIARPENNDFSGVDLTKVNNDVLSNINLINANLDGVNLTNSIYLISI